MREEGIQIRVKRVNKRDEIRGMEVALMDADLMADMTRLSRQSNPRSNHDEKKPLLLATPLFTRAIAIVNSA